MLIIKGWSWISQVVDLPCSEHRVKAGRRTTTGRRLLAAPPGVGGCVSLEGHFFSVLITECGARISPEGRQIPKHRRCCHSSRGDKRRFKVAVTGEHHRFQGLSLVLPCPPLLSPSWVFQQHRCAHSPRACLSHASPSLSQRKIISKDF